MGFCDGQSVIYEIFGTCTAPELTAKVKVRVSVNNNNSSAGELTDKYRCFFLGYNFTHGVN